MLVPGRVSVVSRVFLLELGSLCAKAFPTALLALSEESARAEGTTSSVAVKKKTTIFQMCVRMVYL